MARSFAFHRILLCTVVLIGLFAGTRAFAQPNDLIVEVCGTPSAQASGEISDINFPVQNMINIPPTGSIHDLDVRLDINHTWVGDLVIVVQHLETGTFALLIDRPGVGAANPAGCGTDDLHVILDDEGTGGALDSLCSAPGTSGFPTSPPNFTPIDSLDVFDDEELGGNWLITITDVRPENAGALVSWCLRANLGPAGIRATNSAMVDNGTDTCAEPAEQLVVAPGTSVRVCYTVENIGELMLDTHSLNSSLHGDVLVNGSQVLAPGGDHSVTRLAVINQDTTITGTWNSRRGAASLSASDSITILIDSDGDGRSDANDACPGGDDFADSDSDGTADFCDACPSDEGKIAPGNCGCGIPEGGCGAGNENVNGNDNNNTNGNGNSNSNENTNGNENTNTNGNDNQNTNGNENQNTNTNGNENSNTNTNENQNQNANNNSNNNQNPGNQNQNTNNNTNDNAANNINSNDNSNANVDGNLNANDNTDINGNTNQPPSDSPFPDCNIDCGNGLCGAGVNAYLALPFLFLLAARNRRRK